VQSLSRQTVGTFMLHTFNHTLMDTWNSDRKLLMLTVQCKSQSSLKVLSITYGVLG